MGQKWFRISFRMQTTKKAIRQLNLSGFKTIDTCTANGHFLQCFRIGYDAHIAHLFAQENKRGFSNYMRLILESFVIPSKIHLTYNGQERSVMHLSLLSNATQFGNNAIISPAKRSR